MRLSTILIALITLCQVASAQGPSLNAQSEHEQTMLRIQREMDIVGDLRDLMEIREYTHPLLKKYLPDYRFYLSYIPAHRVKDFDRDGNARETLVKASYLTGLGVVDPGNRFSLFSARPRRDLDLGMGLLKNANITRSATSRTDDELKEIASMYLILSSLKGLNGSGLLALTDDEDGFTTIRDVKPEEFTLNRGENGITASYKIDNDREILECSLNFDLNGNVTAGKAREALVGKRK
jgi:hypothetical protein